MKNICLIVCLMCALIYGVMGPPPTVRRSAAAKGARNDSGILKKAGAAAVASLMFMSPSKVGATDSPNKAANLMLQVGKQLHPVAPEHYESIPMRNGHAIKMPNGIPKGMPFGRNDEVDAYKFNVDVPNLADVYPSLAKTMAVYADIDNDGSTVEKIGDIDINKDCTVDDKDGTYHCAAKFGAIKPDQIGKLERISLEKGKPSGTESAKNAVQPGNPKGTHNDRQLKRIAMEKKKSAGTESAKNSIQPGQPKGQKNGQQSKGIVSQKEAPAAYINRAKTAIQSGDPNRLGIQAKKTGAGGRRLLQNGAAPISFTVVNRCAYDIMVTASQRDQIGLLAPTPVPSGQSIQVTVPGGLEACRMWATKMDAVQNAEKSLQHVSLFEWSQVNGQTWYDVSYVDEVTEGIGVFVPQTGKTISFNQAAIDAIPATMRDDRNGVPSVCDKFQTETACCSGAHSTPDTCQPQMAPDESAWLQSMQAISNDAYFYAYDDVRALQKEDGYLNAFTVGFGTNCNDAACGAGSPQQTSVPTPDPAQQQPAGAVPTPDPSQQQQQPGAMPTPDMQQQPGMAYSGARVEQPYVSSSASSNKPLFGLFGK